MGLTLTPKGNLPDRVFHTDSVYMLDVVSALILTKLLSRKKRINFPKRSLCIKPCSAQNKIFPDKPDMFYKGFGKF